MAPDGLVTPPQPRLPPRAPAATASICAASSSSGVPGPSRQSSVAATDARHDTGRRRGDHPPANCPYKTPVPPTNPSAPLPLPLSDPPPPDPTAPNATAVRRSIPRPPSTPCVVDKSRSTLAPSSSSTSSHRAPDGLVTPPQPQIPWALAATASICTASSSYGVPGPSRQRCEHTRALPSAPSIFAIVASPATTPARYCCRRSRLRSSARTPITTATQGHTLLPPPSYPPTTPSPAHSRARPRRLCPTAPSTRWSSPSCCSLASAVAAFFPCCCLRFPALVREASTRPTATGARDHCPFAAPASLLRPPRTARRAPAHDAAVAGSPAADVPRCRCLAAPPAPDRTCRAEPLSPRRSPAPQPSRAVPHVMLPAAAALGYRR
nr:mucin-2-like [Aegilops tauschii subsp. strangulata]